MANIESSNSLPMRFGMAAQRRAGRSLSGLEAQSDRRKSPILNVPLPYYCDFAVPRLTRALLNTVRFIYI